MPTHCPWCGKELEAASGALRPAPEGICDECAERLHLIRTLWQYSARPQRFRIVVIHRRHAALYQSVRRALEGFPNLRVLIDRRFGERRTAAGRARRERRSGRERRHSRQDLLLV